MKSTTSIKRTRALSNQVRLLLRPIAVPLHVVKYLRSLEEGSLEFLAGHPSEKEIMLVCYEAIKKDTKLWAVSGHQTYNLRPGALTQCLIQDEAS